jgi:hypothetical protein
LRYRKIAAALSISHAAVSISLARALERLVRQTGSCPGEKMFLASNRPELAQNLRAFFKKWREPAPV